MELWQQVDWKYPLEKSSANAFSRTFRVKLSKVDVLDGIGSTLCRSRFWISFDPNGSVYSAVNKLVEHLIEEYGLEPFARKCIESVFTYTAEWEALTEQVGFWVDMEDAYVTYHRSYVESVWWALSELFKKGLLYKGHKVLWWWPQGGTALSSGEVGQGYKVVDDPSVTIRFRLDGEPNTSLLAWTTTPWTLPSNTAIAVNPDVDYAFVAIPGGSEVKSLGLVAADETVVLADALREKYGLEGFPVTQVVRGSELLGRTYAPVFDFATPEGDKHWLVIPGDHVTLQAGTGLVHTAPAFGEDDYRVAKAQGVGMLQLVAPDGTFVPGTGYLEGVFCKDADNDIIRDLKTRELLFKRASASRDALLGALRLEVPDGVDEAELDSPCISCPWHGWTFRLADGSGVGNQAGKAQPVYPTRVAHDDPDDPEDGEVEVGFTSLGDSLFDGDGDF